MSVPGHISPRLRVVAFLAGLCLFLATLEYLIPKPLPFLRIGLSHIPVLLVLSTFRRRDLCLLVGLKVLGQALVHGTLFSYVLLFSLAGNLGGLIINLLCIPLLHRNLVSLVGVSVLGALASNMVQMLLSVTLIFGNAALIVLLPFLIFGTVGGVLTGIVAHRWRSAVQWIIDEYKKTVSS